MKGPEVLRADSRRDAIAVTLMRYEIWATHDPSDVQTVKIILILMTLRSIKTYQEVNVWESLSLYQRLGLAGWQLTHGHHFLSWGRSVFVPEAPDHAGLCLGC